MGNGNLRKTKRTLSIMVSVILVVTLFFGPRYKVFAADTKHAKNVIMFIADGTSIEALTLARWYNGGKPFAMDELAVGLTRTYWKNGPITDSAPGGTAYSTGYKSEDGHVAVLSEEEGNKPVATILEAARLIGKSTGVVTTCELMHATPATFTAHDQDRDNYNSIMKQQIYSGVDVILSGGDAYLSPDGGMKPGEKRNDGIDLRNTIRNLGYEYITTREDMLKSTSSKIWGAFARKDLQYDLDRQLIGSKEPTLEEMTKKAIEVLSKDKDGFFLMVEGSKVDWAAHANDPVGVVTEIVAYDNAIKAALDFAKADGSTVIVASEDHGTGGLAVGTNLVKEYSLATFDETINKLKVAKATTVGYSSTTALKGVKDADVIRKAFKDYYGIENLTDKEVKAIIDVCDDVKKLGIIIGQTVSTRANIGWTTTGHVGGDVALFNYAPAYVEGLKGVVENINVSKYMARVLGVDLEYTTKKLFVGAKASFESLGAQVSLDTTDTQNPVFKVVKGNNTLVLPVFTNKGAINGTPITFRGITVCTGEYDISTNISKYSVENVYVHQDATDLFKAVVQE